MAISFSGYAKAAALLVSVLLVTGEPSFASFVLSLGAYSKAEAESLHQQLAARGYPVYLLYGETYEVRVGGFDTREKAEAAVNKLKDEERVVARIEEEEDLDQYQLSFDVPDSTDSADISGSTGEDIGRDVDQNSYQAYSDPRAQKIVSLGLDLFGHPYKYGGTKIGSGIDCSFFVQSIFKELGINLPRTSREQAQTGVSVEKVDLQVGDLLFFNKTYYSRSAVSSKRKKRGKKRATTYVKTSVTRINHVGIYIGNGEFIHATINGKRVTISRLDERYFVEHFALARRVLK